MPNRHGSTADYRYGFQGQEKDDEIKGEGKSLNYTFRMHDPRVGRFFAIDPLTKKYPWYTPYSFSGNKPIQFVELEGLEESNTAAGSVIMGLLFPTPPKLRKEPWKSPGASAANAGAPIAGVAIGAVPVAVPAAYATSAAYASYTTWYGTSLLSNYLAAGVGGTSSLAALDANSYFGSSLWQTSGRTALFNGMANIVGQLMYNNGFDNFNYSQTVFASVVGNPFLSNFGESNIFVGSLEDGSFGMKAHNFDTEFFSTFGSNFLGSFIGKTPSTVTYKAAANILDFTKKGAIETFENKLGDDLKSVINTFSDFEIDKSFRNKKKTGSGF